MFPTAEPAKWLETMRISWSKLMAYKINFVVMVLGPTLVFFFIKYNLWSAIFSTDPGGKIAGYDFETMINYQVWTLIISLVGTGSNSMALAEDIRMGRISSYLIYPFQFWKFHFASFLSFQGLQVFIALLTIVTVASSGLLTVIEPLNVLNGLLFSCCVGIYWFSVQFLMGLVAFWLEETWILRVIFIQVSYFLSGTIMPLEIFPQWLVTGLKYTPFPYTTYVPAKIFMGQYTEPVIEALGILLTWTLLFIFLNRWVWRKGIRMYTAAGM